MTPQRVNSVLLPEVSPEHSFQKLCLDVSGCRKCPRMAESVRVLNHGAGPLSASIMFVGEAPGRLGADKTSVPFHGDKAGHNFETLLDHAGLSRHDIFVTNAVLCNPRADGVNATPSTTEVDNCNSYLQKQIEIVNPKIVVSLGGKSLEALRLIESHALKLSSHVRTAHQWFGRLLIPAYHSGQRAMIHRSMANQRSDFQFIAEQYRRLHKTRKPSVRPSHPEISEIVCKILAHLPKISYFGLHKLFYLIEYTSVQQTGAKQTNAYVLRQKDGPYFTDLHIQKLKKAIPELEIENIKDKLYLRITSSGLFAAPHRTTAEMDKIVESVVEKYGDYDDAELKQAVYMTGPMRWILRAEKNGLNLFNFPIDFTKSANSPLP